MGCGHLIIQTDNAEISLILFVQKILNRKPLIGFIREIWFFGRTTFLIIILLIITAFDWQLGVIAFAVFLVTAAIEMLIKVSLNRKRPFQNQPKILMLQPQEPSDPSFPSGDTFRIWYLALTLAFVFGNDPNVLMAMILIALLVSVGRLAMGVHYFTDILAGAGLGLIAAGTAIWVWFYLGLL
jgi:membrane-associated phospholipid phosphatase